MHAITEQLLSNDKTKDIQYTVYPEMSVVVQLVRFPQNLWKSSYTTLHYTFSTLSQVMNSYNPF